MALTATIKSIKTEDGKLRAVVDFSDGATQAYVCAPEAGIENIHLQIADALRTKTFLNDTVEDLQAEVGSVISLDAVDINKAKVKRADNTEASLIMVEKQAE